MTITIRPFRGVDYRVYLPDCDVFGFIMRKREKGVEYHRGTHNNGDIILEELNPCP